MSLMPVPTLDELAAHPERALELPPEVARDLLARLAPLQTVLLAQALTRSASGDGGQPETRGEDRLLSVKEAARKMNVSSDYIYRHAKDLPFTVRVGSRLLFSERGIEQWVRHRQGR